MRKKIEHNVVMNVKILIDHGKWEDIVKRWKSKLRAQSARVRPSYLITPLTLMGKEPEKPHVSSAKTVPAISGPLGIRISADVPPLCGPFSLRSKYTRWPSGMDIGESKPLQRVTRTRTGTFALVVSTHIVL